MNEQFHFDRRFQTIIYLKNEISLNKNKVMTTKYCQSNKFKFIIKIFVIIYFGKV